MVLGWLLQPLGVDLTRHFHREPLQVTDLDLLAFDLNPQLTPRKYIGEDKSGTGKNAPKALDRLIWLRGLRGLVEAESGELTIASPPSQAGAGGCPVARAGGAVDPRL